MKRFRTAALGAIAIAFSLAAQPSETYKTRLSPVPIDLQLAPGADPQMSIERAATILEGRYGIAHTTLQPEQAPSPRLVEFSA